MQFHSFRSLGRFLLAACVVGLGTSSVIAQTAAPAPAGFNPSRADIFLGYSFYGPHEYNKPSGLRYNSIPAGAIGSFAYYFNNHVGGEVSYSNYPSGANDGYSEIKAGAIFRFPMQEMTLFGHGLVGAGRLGGPNDPNDALCGTNCYHNPYQWGPSITVGGGLDYNTHLFNGHFAYRLFQADYDWVHEDYGPAVAPPTYGAIGGRSNIPAVELSTGILWRLGSIVPPPPVAYSCAAAPSTVFPGDPVTVTGTATNLNPKKTATYSWTSDSGPATSTTATVNINTGTLAPGNYTVKGHVTEGAKPGQSADCSAQFTVRAYEPPTISCYANPSTVDGGGSSTITSQAASPQNRPLTYSYSASAGSINGSTATATLSTAGAARGSTITVTCNVSDDKGQSASGRTSVSIRNPPPPPPPPPPPAPQASTLCTVDFARDARRPTRVNNEGKACLDEVALSMQRQSDARLYLTGNAHAANDRKVAQARAEHEAAERAVNTKAYLVSEKGIDASRIVVYTGSADNNTVTTTLVPSGATAPSGTPVDESKVKANAAAARTTPARRGK